MKWNHLLEIPSYKPSKVQPVQESTSKYFDKMHCRLRQAAVHYNNYILTVGWLRLSPMIEGGVSSQWNKGHMPLMKFKIVCFYPWLKKLSWGRGEKGAMPKTSICLVMIKYSRISTNHYKVDRLSANCEIFIVRGLFLYYQKSFRSSKLYQI